MKIVYSKRFVKEHKKCPIGIKKKVELKVEIFLYDKFQSSLNNHKLFGKLKKCRSINIDADWRILYEEKEGGVVYFVALGTHNKLYS